MGTNYYARFKACEHCGRSDEDIHICKSLTMFQGYRNHETVGTIQSVADWRVFLARPDVRVFDEYQAEHDVAEFLAAVDKTTLAQRRQQFDWMLSHGRDMSADWLDPEGFSFCSQEFS